MGRNFSLNELARMFPGSKSFFWSSTNGLIAHSARHLVAGKVMAKGCAAKRGCKWKYGARMFPASRHSHW